MKLQEIMRWSYSNENKNYLKIGHFHGINKFVSTLTVS